MEKLSLKKVSATLLADWLKADEPPENWGDCLCIEGSFDQRHETWWADWDKEMRPLIEKCFQIAELVNEALWQIDNTVMCRGVEVCDFSNTLIPPSRAIKKLWEYGLISVPKVKKATTLEVLEFAELKVIGNANASDILYYAIKHRRFDVVAAILKPTVERTAYWRNYYRDCLGQPDIDFWSWNGNPEAWDICPELSMLMKLPMPDDYSFQILQALPEQKNPFYDASASLSPLRSVQDAFSEDRFKAFLTSGRFKSWKPSRKNEAQEFFMRWHKQAITQVGEAALKSIYKVCFNCNWEIIEDILSPMLPSGEWWEVLGVSKTANRKEIKAAYTEKSKQWHPDLCKHPKAKEAFIAIRFAYDQATNKIPRIESNVW